MPTATAHPSSASLAPAATITVCGRPSAAAVAAIVDIVLAAGLGLIVQPQPALPAQRFLPATTDDVVEAAPGRRVARRQRRAKRTAPPPVSSRVTAARSARKPGPRPLDASSILAAIKPGVPTALADILRGTDARWSKSRVRAALRELLRRRQVVRQGKTGRGVRWLLAPTATPRNGERLTETRRRAETEYETVSVGRGLVSDAVAVLNHRS